MAVKEVVLSDLYFRKSTLVAISRMNWKETAGSRETIYKVIKIVEVKKKVVKNMKRK